HTRKTLGIPEDAYVVCNITRAVTRGNVNSQAREIVNYRKDPFGFILLASSLSKKHPDAVFLMSGSGTQWGSPFIKALCTKANEITGGVLNESNFKQLGHVENISDIYKISNIQVSTS